MSNTKGKKSNQHEIYIKEFNENFKIAPSAYARALNYLASNDVKKAKDQLDIISKAWAQHGVTIDIDESINKMRSELDRMSKEGLIESAPAVRKKTGFEKNPYIDNEYAVQTSRQQATSRANNPTNNIAPPPPPATTFEFNKDSMLNKAQGVKSLNDFTDEEIYDSGTKLDPSTVRNGDFVIDYNNVKYGGYGINIKINFSNIMSEMHDSEIRINLINDYLNANKIKINEIENLTPIALMKEIANSINNKPELNLQQKESMLEDITKRLTQIMLNETDLSNDYLLSTEQRIRGRNYSHVSTAGGLVNSLYSNVALNDKGKIQGTIGTNMLVKIGSADCRGTNATYAALLNIGYEQLSSPKQAKIFYTKMSHGTTKDDFANSNPEDHNIVLVKEHNGKVVIRDAYFNHVDNTSLRTAITGSVKEGNLTRDENEVSGMRNWAFQIPGAPPYPAQQKLLTNEQRLNEQQKQSPNPQAIVRKSAVTHPAHPAQLHDLSTPDHKPLYTLDQHNPKIVLTHLAVNIKRHIEDLVKLGGSQNDVNNNYVKTIEELKIALKEVDDIQNKIQQTQNRALSSDDKNKLIDAEQKYHRSLAATEKLLEAAKVNKQKEPHESHHK